MRRGWVRWRLGWRIIQHRHQSNAPVNANATAHHHCKCSGLPRCAPLAADTAEALQAPIDDLGLPWTIETRTGDTSSAARNRQRTKLPTALVTTPESLSLLLARPNAEELFASLQAVIVDEWHELMATKRGVQTEVALARLRRWRPELRTWGLSATMGNLEVALRTLIGTAEYTTGEINEGRLIQGDMSKQLYFESIIPPMVERFPWAGHLGLKLLPQVIEQIEANRTTLVFTNTRNPNGTLVSRDPRLSRRVGGRDGAPPQFARPNNA
jgi:ATP-dependent Lhr-like helicase